MSDQTVARRYARALYETAQENDQVDAVDEDVALIRQSLQNARDLRLLFERPIVRREKKEQVTVALFEERVEPLTLRFLRLLIHKKRDTIVPEVMQAYEHLRDDQQGLVEATARTAVPLGETERKKLVEELEALTDKNIRLQVQEDASLIGGLVVRIGDTVYDGSVEHQLETLRNRFETQALSEYSGDGAPPGS